jgi:DNA-binding SARP family transcriptional activator
VQVKQGIAAQGGRNFGPRSIARVSPGPLHKISSPNHSPTCSWAMDQCSDDSVEARSARDRMQGKWWSFQPIDSVPSEAEYANCAYRPATGPGRGMRYGNCVEEPDSAIVAVGPSQHPLDTPGHITPLLRLLGGFVLQVSGNPIPLPVTGQRLLAFLGLSHRPTRSAVAGQLWPEASEGHALGSLRSAVWRVQRRVPHLLDCGEGGLSLRPEVRVDVRDLVAVARNLLAVDSGAARIGEDKATLLSVLLTSDLLPGWYEEWVLAEREHLLQLRLHALERLAALLSDRGQYGAALDVALTCIQMAPLRESAHRSVIHIHMDEGNNVEAARHFTKVCRLFELELGLGPSPLLAELGRQLGSVLGYTDCSYPVREARWA